MQLSMSLDYEIYNRTDRQVDQERSKKHGGNPGALAMTSGTGLRFIIELEKGKPTCQFGKVLTVINTLGISMTLTLPLTDE